MKKEAFSLTPQGEAMLDAIRKEGVAMRNKRNDYEPVVVGYDSLKVVGDGSKEKLRSTSSTGLSKAGLKSRTVLAASLKRERLVSRKVVMESESSTYPVLVFADEEEIEEAAEKVAQLTPEELPQDEEEAGWISVDASGEPSWYTTPAWLIVDPCMLENLERAIAAFLRPSLKFLAEDPATFDKIQHARGVRQEDIATEAMRRAIRD